MNIRLSLLLVMLLGFSTTVFGQGNVVFNNFGPNTNWRIWTNNSLGTASNLMSGNGYQIGLYVGATNSSSLELVGLTSSQGLAPGYFTGINPLTLPAPYAAGTPINFQLRAWSTAPFSLAMGQSAIGTVTPAGVGPAAPLFGTTAGLLTRGFGISVPEPSSIALGLLGLVAIALFRRRK